jgi:hypothetical protein
MFIVFYSYNLCTLFPEFYVRSNIPVTKRKKLSLTIDKIYVEFCNGLLEYVKRNIKRGMKEQRKLKMCTNVA